MTRLAELIRTVRAHQAGGRRIGFTCGVFDLLHRGHVEYLAEARRRCDFLIVAVNTDASVARLKGPGRPLQPVGDRMAMMAALAAVDAVIPQDDDRPEALLRALRPDFYFKGGDYDPGRLRSAAVLDAWGGKTEVIAADSDLSSSELVFRVLAADRLRMEAAKPLGRAPGLLVDRDGTLNEEGRLTLLPGAARALRRLQDAGMRIAIITNRQSLGLGIVNPVDAMREHGTVLRALGEHGVDVWRIYQCPHVLPERCDCRKPRPGMILRALNELNLDPRSSCVVGNRDVDLEAGRAAGLAVWSVAATPWCRVADEILERLGSL
ncbi:MAG TPA: HAD-IIIA family hydrolase [Planctomycetes bacterium]|nr:HAD-IIIA family hydrolase [Planctomycetota bacterium]